MRVMRFVCNGRRITIAPSDDGDGVRPSCLWVCRCGRDSCDLLSAGYSYLVAVPPESDPLVMRVPEDVDPLQLFDV